MVRIRDVAWVLAAAAALAGSRPAAADAITLTGNVANDFTAANGSVEVPIGSKNASGVFQYTSGPDYVAVQQTVANALPSGAFMQNIWFNYNASTDTMSVGIQGFTNANGHEIIGDMSGAPNAAQDSNTDPALGPISSATNTFLGTKSLAIAFAPITTNSSGQSAMGTPTIIAGIPAVKNTSTTPDFMVAHYSANNSGLAFSFGTQIANGGSLAFNTTAATPDFEFTIKNFSKVTGINPADGFYVEGFDGMAGSSAGKSQFTDLETPPVPQGINTPEPTTWLAWMLMAGGAGWRRYRRRLMARA
jgi:hypothetical protein